MIFRRDKLKKALDDFGIMAEKVEMIQESNLVRVVFKDTKVAHVNIPLQFNESYNCLNIYTETGKKHIFTWEGVLNYTELAESIYDINKSK